MTSIPFFEILSKFAHAKPKAITMNKNKYILFILLIFSVFQLNAQAIKKGKWNVDFSLGATANAGNVNNCNITNSGMLKRNDSLIAFDFHYKLLYSAALRKDDFGEEFWEKTNFEINGGLKFDLYQYGLLSPFLACEMLTNKFKGYDIKLSGLIGMKYRIFVRPKICDYSISAAVVYDWIDYTDETKLPKNNFRVSIRPKFTQKLVENLTLLHTTFYQPSVLDFGDFIIHTTTKLQSKLSKTLFLDLSFTYEYRSRVPSKNYKHHDFTTEVSFRIKI